jgi:hypothetical protein
VAIHAGYLVDLNGVQFDDEASTTWIHGMSVGLFHHPMYGKITITPERIRRFADNFAKRVRGIDIAIDYDHRAHGGDAAGWVRQAEARPDGLWLLVEWTKTAYTKIKEKAYRYFSPEFLDEWEHPETKQKFQDVLFGGGITNRPFLKNLVPINMTEFMDSSGGTSMDPAEVLKQLAKLFGLPEDTDPGVVLGYVQAKLGEKPEEEEGNDSGGDSGNAGAGGGGNPPPGQQSGPPQTKAASENGSKPDEKAGEGTNGVQLTEAALLQLPFVKSLMETVTGQGKKLDEDAIDKAIVQLSEKASTKGKAIPPVIKDGLKKQLSEIPPAQRPGVIKLFETMVDEGQIGVELGEKGGAGTGGGGKTAAEAINTAVTKKMSESNGKLNYADAVTMVAQEQPQLYVDYQRELANA